MLQDVEWVPCFIRQKLLDSLSMSFLINYSWGWSITFIFVIAFIYRTCYLVLISESGHRLDSGSPFWRIQLDQDLLDTISAIYPEWFKVSFNFGCPKKVICMISWNHIIYVRVKQDYTNSRASASSSSSSSSSSRTIRSSSNDDDSSTAPTDSSAVIEHQAHNRTSAKAETKSKLKAKRLLESSRERREKRDLKEDR